MGQSAERAVELFEQGFNCAQSVLAGCGEGCGLDRRTSLAVAEAFGGGMGGMGLTCGAVTGALMVIGLRYAGLTPEQDAPSQAPGRSASRRESAQLARRFRQAFEARNGSICCRELLGCDISTPEGHRQAAERGLFREVCPKMVRDAAEIVERILAAPEDAE